MRQGTPPIPPSSDFPSAPEALPGEPAFTPSFPPGFRTVLGALWLSNLLGPLFISGVMAVLPAMGRDLQATAVELSLLVVVVMLSQAIFGALGGRFADLWGLRRILLVGVALFTLFTVAIGVAQYTGLMLVFRFLQGTAAALISCCVIAIGVRLAPPERRGQVLGILTSAVYMGLTLGPLIAGTVTSLFHWRWFFLGTALPGTLLWLLLRRVIRQEWRDSKGETLDVRGALLLSAGLGLVAVGAGGIGILPYAAWLIVPGLAVLVLFYIVEGRTPYPFINTDMLRNTPGLRIGLLAVFANYAAIMSVIFLFSLYLQQVKGLTPFQAGLALMAQTIVQMATAPLGGRMADKLGAERVAACGMALCGLGLLCAAFLGKTSPLSLLLLAQALLGVGIGFFGSPNMVSTLRYVTGRNIAVASGLIGSMRTMGGLLGQLIISVVIGYYMGDAKLGPDTIDSFLSAMRVALIGFGLLNLCGIFIGVKRTLKS